jgi:triphosphoribosyl-dephospho-CoA synthase
MSALALVAREGIARTRHAADAPQAIAALAANSLRLEVDTWPKPGLVSHRDTGSHHDMDAQTFYRSAAAIEPFLRALVVAGMQDADMATLRSIGIDAERAMLAATDGVNTHRGAIFGMGLLCAAAGLRLAGHADPMRALGALVSDRWGRDILVASGSEPSHGNVARHRFGAGGARHEAACGFPTVYQVGLPALAQAAQLAPYDPEAQRVHACLALMAVLEDTNLLYRGGEEGLTFARSAARRFIDAGGVGRAAWQEDAIDLHRQFVARRLSPGGAADLLGLSLFVRDLQRTGWSP